MAINLRKDAINLQKDSEPSLDSKPKTPSSGTGNSRSQSQGVGIHAGVKRELGTWGGIDVEAKAVVSIDLEAEARSQGISASIDASGRSVSLSAGLGSARGKLGGNVAIGLGIDEEGNVSVEGGKVEVSIAGVGFNVEGNRDGSAAIGAEIGGFSVEVSRDGEGKPSLTLGWGIGGAEVSITFTPNEEKEVPAPAPTPTPTPTPAPTPTPTPINPRRLPTTKLCKDDEMVVALAAPNIDKIPLNGDASNIPWKLTELEPALQLHLDLWRSSKNVLATETYYFRTQLAGVDYINTASAIYNANGIYADFRPADEIAIATWKKHWDVTEQLYSLSDFRAEIVSEEFFGGNWHWKKSLPSGYNGTVFVGWDFFDKIVKYELSYKYDAYTFIVNGVEQKIYCSPYDFAVKILDIVPAPQCPEGDTPIEPQLPRYISLILPNYPQQYKSMNCCDKVEEIYKYLGIAKLKKHKFKVAKQFLSPGGKGNEDCEDYYAITQALFRMLANGLIINPISKPLGNPWQNVNATAWASQMYEMMAETMSDGNNTQKVEISTIMQLVQMMKLLAETSRKVELIIDALGVEPDTISEELPVCFTIHESHKGFGKKETKQIDITKTKTDNDVEKVLGKMLAPSKIPIIKWEFKPGAISVIEALRNNNG